VLDRIDCGEREVIAWTFGVKQTIELLMARRGTPTTILATGDPMHFGIGATLMRDLDASEMRVIPSPSAFSLAASRLGWATCRTWRKSRCMAARCMVWPRMFNPVRGSSR
jgi:precorrin-6Y C5,15-methyltransferase (decarboxylating)